MRVRVCKCQRSCYTVAPRVSASANKNSRTYQQTRAQMTDIFLTQHQKGVCKYPRRSYNVTSRNVFKCQKRSCSIASCVWLRVCGCVCLGVSVSVSLIMFSYSSPLFPPGTCTVPFSLTCTMFYLKDTRFF